MRYVGEGRRHKYTTESGCNNLEEICCAVVWFGTNGTVWCDACNATTRNEHISQAASYDLPWFNVCVYYLASIRPRPRHRHHQQQRLRFDTMNPVPPTCVFNNTESYERSATTARQRTTTTKKGINKNKNENPFTAAPTTQNLDAIKSAHASDDRIILHKRPRLVFHGDVST